MVPIRVAKFKLSAYVSDHAQNWVWRRDWNTFKAVMYMYVHQSGHVYMRMRGERVHTYTDTLFAYFQSFVLTSYQTKTRPLLCRFVLEGNTSVSKSSPTDGVKRWFTLTPCAPKQPWTRPLSQHKHINYTNHVRYMFFMRKCQFIIQFLRVLIKQVWSYLRIHWLVFENDLDPG